MKVWLQGYGATPHEIPVYVATMRELFHHASEAEYLAKLENLKKTGVVLFYSTMSRKSTLRYKEIIKFIIYCMHVIL